MRREELIVGVYLEESTLLVIYEEELKHLTFGASSAEIPFRSKKMKYPHFNSLLSLSRILIIVLFGGSPLTREFCVILFNTLMP